MVVQTVFFFFLVSREFGLLYSYVFHNALFCDSESEVVVDKPIQLCHISGLLWPSWSVIAFLNTTFRFS